MSNSKNDSCGNLLLGVVFGLACGYVAGILTAKKPGRELRKELGIYSSDIAHRVTDRFDNFKVIVKEKMAELKNFSDEKLKKTAKNIEELVESLDKQLDELSKKQETASELN